MDEDAVGVDSGSIAPLLLEPQTSRIAGPFRRFFAFAIDSFLIGIFGAVIGAAFFETLVQLGTWARFIGLLVSLLYFGLSESRAGGGRSPGKRLLGLKLVNEEGAALTFEEASLRFLVFGIPFLANGFSLPITHGVMLFTTVMALIVFGLGGANFYLTLFNRPTRQGLHDMAVKSYVVRAHPEGVVAHHSIWKGHWIVLGAYLLLICTLPSLIIPKVMKMGSFPQLMDDASRIEQIHGVQNVAANETRTFHAGIESSDRTLSFNVIWAGPEGDEEALTDQIARDVLLNDKTIQNYSTLRIAITRGYDLGIGSRWYSRSFAYPPDEWRQRLQ